MYRLSDPDALGLQGCLLDGIHDADSMNVTLESMWQDWCTVVYLIMNLGFN